MLIKVTYYMSTPSSPETIYWHPQVPNPGKYAARCIHHFGTVRIGLDRNEFA